MRRGWSSRPTRPWLLLVALVLQGVTPDSRDLAAWLLPGPCDRPLDDGPGPAPRGIQAVSDGHGGGPAVADEEGLPPRDNDLDGSPDDDPCVAPTRAIVPVSKRATGGVQGAGQASATGSAGRLAHGRAGSRTSRGIPARGDHLLHVLCRLTC